MKILEYISQNQVAAKNSRDPLMLLGLRLLDEKTKLAGLKGRTSGFLIPIKNKNKIEPGFDPDHLKELEQLLAEMDSSREAISHLQGKTSKIDGILERYEIGPSLHDLKADIVFKQKTIENLRVKISGHLGHALIFSQPDLVLAQADPKVKEAQQNYEQMKAKLEPEIARLENAVKELEEALKA